MAIRAVRHLDIEQFGRIRRLPQHLYIRKRAVRFQAQLRNHLIRANLIVFGNSLRLALGNKVFPARHGVIHFQSKRPVFRN